MRRPTITMNCPTVGVKRKAQKFIKSLHKDMTMTRFVAILAEHGDKLITKEVDVDSMLKDVSKKFNLFNYKP